MLLRDGKRFALHMDTPSTYPPLYSGTPPQTSVNGEELSNILWVVEVGFK